MSIFTTGVVLQMVILHHLVVFLLRLPEEKPGKENSVVVSCFVLKSVEITPSCNLQETFIAFCIVTDFGLIFLKYVLLSS